MLFQVWVSQAPRATLSSWPSPCAGIWGLPGSPEEEQTDRWPQSFPRGILLHSPFRRQGFPALIKQPAGLASQVGRPCGKASPSGTLSNPLALRLTPLFADSSPEQLASPGGRCGELGGDPGQSPE